MLTFLASVYVSLMTHNSIGRRTFVKAVGAGALVASSSVASAARPPAKRFKAHLTGDEEVPPVDTNAQGQANFKLSKDGSELSYKVNVANIEDVIGVHIHNESAGVNGDIVVFLFGEPFVDNEDAVTVNGTFLEGTIADGDVRGLSELSALLDEMRAGNTYVNVHTIGVRSGEIRGQIS